MPRTRPKPAPPTRPQSPQTQTRHSLKQAQPRTWFRTQIQPPQKTPPSHGLTGLGAPEFIAKKQPSAPAQSANAAAALAGLALLHQAASRRPACAPHHCLISSPCPVLKAAARRFHVPDSKQKSGARGIQGGAAAIGLRWLWRCGPAAGKPPAARQAVKRFFCSLFDSSQTRQTVRWRRFQVESPTKINLALR